ncbi:rhodanese-related sulfurtransferase [Candidatus Erwinia haradaeae]|uniref:tRNA uridine(34) hydroxylase n=1 Tax=Candidatus Erwinia haradaeae TaxID=1922217 RepID=A0A451D9B4_9GAMM|nr:rhodanese-related sulfurtransferase [Candidatus Erwinia haradaeae]VFP82857.1 UPF0176 protein YceA [Candidatus Erwinia haradaeae]
MSVLHNTIPRKELQARVLAEPDARMTVSFYKYFTLDDPFSFRDALYLALSKLRIFGRIYVSQEGINAQVSVPHTLYSSMEDMLYAFHPSFSDLQMNIALDNNKQSFWVLSIKIRAKLVADGITDTSFNASDVGVYIDAKTVNKLHDDVNAIFVDMRNDYEYAIGHFHKALAIPGRTFRQQLSTIIGMLQGYKEYPIVLYCTGGIRCEKSSAWMRYHGYKNVYQIQGGIINYVHTARAQGLQVYFIGKNFVFDKRMAEYVSEDIVGSCYQCGKKDDHYINCRNNRCHKLFIQCLTCSKKFSYFCSRTCMNTWLYYIERS